MKKLPFFAICLTLGLTAGAAPCQGGEHKEGVADASEMWAPVEISQEGLTPITGEEIEDGTYPIEVECSSAMFPIDDCQLTVKDGEMTALLTLGGQGYLMLYMGTGAEAVEDQEDSYISFQLDEEGRQTYQVPVEALDQLTSCASFSKRRQKWYDRTLLFHSSSLPDQAMKHVAAATPESLGLSDGEYTVQFSLLGGSGHTKVENPAKIKVEDGKASMTLVFGNGNYDYVIVGEETYRWEEGENSTFTFPVKGFDCQIPLIADTTALGKPRELDFTLLLDSSTILEAQP
ncbi:MAG: hypothetical protein Q4D55_03780 [Eubacteriales bacterium]|nr:hypothetical protein [Eubacteriales bacterium]